MIIETVLGFDLRLPGEVYLEAAWPAARRSLFLVRPDTAWPKSVDRMVWPSLFAYPHDHPFGRAELPAVKVEGADPRLALLGLWGEDQPMMEAAARAPANLLAAARPVRIAVLGEPDEDRWGPPVSDALHDVAWTRLGYDVADGSMLSGLMNCGYEGDERQAVTHRFAADINPHGLFAAAAAAEAARLAMNARVPEHAPFFVFAIDIGGPEP